MNTSWLVFPVAFLILQNAYFGWNTFPKSDAELIVDGINLMMFLLVALGQSISESLVEKGGVK